MGFGENENVSSVYLNEMQLPVEEGSVSCLSIVTWKVEMRQDTNGAAELLQISGFLYETELTFDENRSILWEIKNG